MSSFLLQNFKYLLFGLLVLILSCNSKMDIIRYSGTYERPYKELRLLPDRTFYYGLGYGGDYSEGNWRKEGDYLLLHFFKEKRSDRKLIVKEGSDNADSIIVKVNCDKKNLSFATVVFKTKAGDKAFQSDLNGRVHLKKTEIDSICIWYVGKETVKYKVKQETSNKFDFNLAYSKGRFNDSIQYLFPDNTLKLLIVEDKLFTDEEYKDTANWYTYFNGNNHFTKRKE